jgi:prolipoprotein diacylglyceryltransferase
MKKITMLIVLLMILFSKTGKAQTLANIQDTIATYAPHAPALVRWDSTAGKKLWGFFDVKYNRDSQDDVIAWMAAYPTEAADYKAKLESYVYGTDPASFTSDADREAFYDIHARWIMIHANDQ